MSLNDETIKIQKCPRSTATFLQAFLRRFKPFHRPFLRRFNRDRSIVSLREAGFVLHDARELASQRFLFDHGRATLFQQFSGIIRINCRFKVSTPQLKRKMAELRARFLL